MTSRISPAFGRYQHAPLYWKSRQMRNAELLKRVDNASARSLLSFRCQAPCQHVATPLTETHQRVKIMNRVAGSGTQGASMTDDSSRVLQWNLKSRGRKTTARARKQRVLPNSSRNAKRRRCSFRDFNRYKFAN